MWRKFSLIPCEHQQQHQQQQQGLKVQQPICYLPVRPMDDKTSGRCYKTFFGGNLDFTKNKKLKKLVDPGLYVKANSRYDCMYNMFGTAKLSMLCGFTNGASMDTSCL